MPLPLRIFTYMLALMILTYCAARLALQAWEIYLLLKTC